MSKSDTIYVAYGFHVNLYHSYRGDSNDGLGFGSDIRIIRKIIDVLNELNEKGIPVKGTWDIENFFSLEKILPEYAPDIISGIHQRVKKYGDENIIMGYNNGALSAMNDDEFISSIELAVSNKGGSGLKDIFGTYEPIVRPQEVMFTPSQVSLYNKCGIKAVCLYYSCIPFDAFRTIIPKLPDEEAYNPLTYRYKGEDLTVIPTYSNADVCDAGCLRAWVKSLRKKQESGEINRDLFIFINMDADAIFWESLDIPLIGGRLANTDGIRGLVNEVADLDYIVFDTPGGYIKNHPPVGKIEFTQDTADGNFTGYSSWAEKPYNRKIWTAIERSRALSKSSGKDDKESASFDDRLLLLSTTHFGLATPVLNIVREKKADELAEKIIKSELDVQERVSSLTIKNINGSLVQSIQLEINGELSDDETLEIFSEDLEDYTLLKCKNSTAFVLMKFKNIKEKYTLNARKIKAKKLKENDLKLKTDLIEIFFDSQKGIKEIKYKGKKIGGENFLESYITYGKKRYNFSVLGVKNISVSGNGKCMKIYGEIHLPNEINGGFFDYDFYTVPFSDAVYIKSEITYPYTPERDSLSTENSSLGRYTDNSWIECVPFQISPELGNNLSVIKRNFSGDVSSYRANSFMECDPENKTLDSFNHQLTGGFTGLLGNGKGIAFAVSRQVLNSMACCPMRFKNGKVSMNPFGTYFGKQRHHFSFSKNEIQNAYTLIAAQGKSIAPAYNGVSELSHNAFFCFDGEIPDDDILNEINAFSDGCIALADESSLLQPFYGDNIKTQKAVSSNENPVKLRSPVLYGIKGNLGKYVIYGAKALGHIIKEQIKAQKTDWKWRK